MCPLLWFVIIYDALKNNDAPEFVDACNEYVHVCETKKNGQETHWLCVCAYLVFNQLSHLV